MLEVFGVGISFFENKDYSSLKNSLNNTPSEVDFFKATYQMWASILAEFSEAEVFRSDLLNSSSRPSFMHNGVTRRKLFGRIKEFDQAINRRSTLDKEWSEPFDRNGSVSDVFLSLIK